MLIKFQQTVFVLDALDDTRGEAPFQFPRLLPHEAPLQLDGGHQPVEGVASLVFGVGLSHSLHRDQHPLQLLAHRHFRHGDVVVDEPDVPETFFLALDVDVCECLSGRKLFH